MGIVNEIHIKQHLPPPNEDTIIMICGVKSKSNEYTIPLLRNLGYKEENLFLF